MTRDEYLKECRDRLLLDTGLAGAAALWDLLHGREAWHVEVTTADVFWCFGLEGACTIEVSVQPPKFVVYVHADDEEVFLNSAADVARWLDEHQPEPGFTDVQQEILDHLAERKLEQWRQDLGMADE